MKRITSAKKYELSAAEMYEHDLAHGEDYPEKADEILRDALAERGHPVESLYLENSGYADFDEWMADVDFGDTGVYVSIDGVLDTDVETILEAYKQEKLEEAEED